MRPTGGARPAWPVVLAWALWLLAMLGLAAVPWLDRLLRQAGRPDLVQFTPGTAFPVVAMVSGATIGAVLASRKPRHPVGWLLLTVALSLTATAAAAQYLTWGLLVRPGALPAARWVSLYYSAIGYTALTSIGLLLLVTPTGSLPSPRWRWWARVMVATPVLLVVVATLAKGPLDPRYQAIGGPFDLRGHGGLRWSPIRSPWPSPRWLSWSRPPVPCWVLRLGSVWRPCRWPRGRRSYATGCTTWIGSSAGRWPTGC